MFFLPLPKIPKVKKFTNEVEDFYQLNQMKTMKNGLFELDKANWKSAFVYLFLAVAVLFLLSIAQSVLDAGSIFGINWKAVVDSAVLAVIPTFIFFLSVVKNLLTTKAGNFLGVVKVIPETE